MEVPLANTIFEADLEKLGLASEFEVLGVLPIIKNPNPYDPEMEEDFHEQWWRENPEKEEKFCQVIWERKNGLRLLLIGSLLMRYAPFFSSFQRHLSAYINQNEKP